MRTSTLGRAGLALALVAAGAAPAAAQPPDHAGSPTDSIPIRATDVSVAVAAPGPEREGPGSGGASTPNLLRDATLLAGGTAGYAMARDKHRGFILRGGSLDNVLANFRRPVRRALAGSDEDSFLTNYVAHPVTWGGISLYLKRQGYSDLGALALSQAHSVFWEYVVEGSYTTPSGRDMVTNFFSAAAVVYGLPLVVPDLFPSRADDGGAPGRDGGPALRLDPTLVAGPAGPVLKLEIRLR